MKSRGHRLTSNVTTTTSCPRPTVAQESGLIAAAAAVSGLRPGPLRPAVRMRREGSGDYSRTSSPIYDRHGVRCRFRSERIVVRGRTVSPCWSRRYRNEDSGSTPRRVDPKLLRAGHELHRAKKCPGRASSPAWQEIFLSRQDLPRKIKRVFACTDEKGLPKDRSSSLLESGYLGHGATV